MEHFEIHITGDPAIIDAAEELSIKTIVIDLLGPDQKRLRTEYMTSFIEKRDSYESCRNFVEEIVQKLKQKVDIIRVKIESPYYPHYEKQSLYIESHFDALDNKLPMSQNVRKTNILATDREYDKLKYEEFRNKYQGVDVELCLYDSFVKEDKDWFDAYLESDQ